jgi:hypothetical protein
MSFIQFSDRLIPYEIFLRDVAATLAKMISEQRTDPDFISQRKAYAMFGRANVERWRRESKVKPCKRPGKTEYCTADLRFLQRQEQDYFKQ